MTPEERAAIEARDKHAQEYILKNQGLPADTVTLLFSLDQALKDVHALLDELRRVEKQRDRAMRILRTMKGRVDGQEDAEIRSLITEIDGEKKQRDRD